MGAETYVIVRMREINRSVYLLTVVSLPCSGDELECDSSVRYLHYIVVMKLLHTSGCDFMYNERPRGETCAGQVMHRPTCY